MWGLELGRHGIDKNKKRKIQDWGKEEGAFNREMRLRLLVGIGDHMKERRVISKGGNPRDGFACEVWF